MLLRKIKKITQQTERFAGYFDPENSPAAAIPNDKSVTLKTAAEIDRQQLLNGIVINSQFKVKLYGQQ